MTRLSDNAPASGRSPDGSGFTSGPWATDGDHGYGSFNGVRVRATKGAEYVLAIVIGDVSELDAAANARLIAAAPELYEALTEISKRCPPLPEGFDEFATISDFGGNADDYAAHVEKLISATTGDIARAVLAKARGEA